MLNLKHSLEREYDLTNLSERLAFWRSLGEVIEDLRFSEDGETRRRWRKLIWLTITEKDGRTIVESFDKYNNRRFEEYDKIKKVKFQRLAENRSCG